MRLDASKIEERIQKLEEIRRIASDPELVEMLFEFIDLDGELLDRSSTELRVSKLEENGETPQSNEARELINRVARSVPG